MELKDATVLLVDDEAMLLDIFGEWLQEEECRVLTAGDGAAALQILRNHYVDVIVSDVRMPVMDGILLLKNLTTYSGPSKNHHQPKMIFITGFTDLEPREAYNLGVEASCRNPSTVLSSWARFGGRSARMRKHGASPRLRVARHCM